MRKRGAAETVRTVGTIRTVGTVGTAGTMRTAGTGEVWRPDGRSEVLLGVQKFAG